MNGILTIQKEGIRRFVRVQYPAQIEVVRTSNWVIMECMPDYDTKPDRDCIPWPWSPDQRAHENLRGRINRF